MKKVGNKRSRVRGHTKTICPRTMYRQAVQPKTENIIHPFVKSAIETWVLFSSIFTIVQLFRMFLG